MKQDKNKLSGKEMKARLRAAKQEAARLEKRKGTAVQKRRGSRKIFYEVAVIVVFVAAAFAWSMLSDTPLGITSFDFSDSGQVMQERAAQQCSEIDRCDSGYFCENGLCAPLPANFFCSADIDCAPLFETEGINCCVQGICEPC